jgi:hypothetical protein
MSHKCHKGRASEWNEEDYNVVADGLVVGRIMKAAAVPVGMSWMWTVLCRPSVRGHRPEIMFGVLVVVFCPDCVSG